MRDRQTGGKKDRETVFGHFGQQSLPGRLTSWWPETQGSAACGQPRLSRQPASR